MKYIELLLKKIDDNLKKEYLLEEVLSNNKFIVLLGSPGSGKTSLLKNYNEKLENSEFLTIKRFLKLNHDLDKVTELLFLDALDEYRSLEKDKAFVIEELGYKLSKLIKQNNSLKIIISCREMDWYGETDKTSLKEEIKCEVGLFAILPLNIAKQKELISLLGIENSEEFLRKFSNKGFLENPQMIKMLSNIWKESQEEFSSKYNIYDKFIKLAKENNDKNERNKNFLEETQRIRIIGYLSFYYIFSNIDEFSDDIIEKIINSEEGYSKENIEWLLNTSIFIEKKFTHRTIAEFALAKFIYDYKLKTELEIEKIKSLFIKNGMIPTELGGTYAWLCSISRDKRFISMNPYYQAIYGDNSFFSIEDKKKVISAVRDYSQINPYFYNWEHRMELEGFYEKDLDELLIKELEKAIRMNNHYIYFLISIINQGLHPSKKIKEFVGKKITDGNLSNQYKLYFINLFENESEFLLEVVKLVNDKKISDESERLKRKLLNILYPEYIGFNEIIDYVNLDEYSEKYIGTYDFLYKTPFEEKYNVVDNILRKHKELKEKYIISEKVEFFVEEYFLEYLLKYGERKNPKEIFNFIEHFNSYYPEYHTIKFKKDFGEKQEDIEKNLIGLADELLEIFIEKKLNEYKEVERLNIYYEFTNFYRFTAPLNYSKIILSFIDEKGNQIINENLLIEAFRLDTNNENFKEIENVSKKLNIESKLKEWVNPEKADWEIKREEWEKERKEKEYLIKEKNEDYFLKKTDNEILNDINSLKISLNFIYSEDNGSNYEKFISKETIERLKKLLKKIIFNNKKWKKSITIKSLIKESPDASREIDRVFYISLVLNNELFPNIELELKKYLYILAIFNENSLRKLQGNFANKLELEENSFCINILKEVIKLYLSTYLNKYKNLFNNLIDKENTIERLKNIVKTFELESNDRFIKVFLKIYGFDMKEEDFIQLEKISLNNENLDILNALILFNRNDKENFEKKDAENLFKIIKGDFSELYKNFRKLNSEKKIRAIDYLLNLFNTKELVAFENESECSEFLNQSALNFFNCEELEKLLNLYNNDLNIWKNRILNKINEKKQSESDSIHDKFKISELKKFILTNTIISKEDFYKEVIYALKEFKNTVEDSRYNELKLFYNNEKSKRENECRDIILTMLKQKYDKIFDFTKEKSEADNRVDINVRYKENLNYEVQIECKIDDNKELYQGIKNQLINKYFSSGVQYGIYFVFYFGEVNSRGQKNIEEMETRLKESIPTNYNSSIKVICINLNKSL